MKIVLLRAIIVPFPILLSFIFLPSSDWGFFSHRLINRQAIYSLPLEMIGFYKNNMDYLSEHAVDPDKRRYVMKNEAPRHYIDLDDFEGDSLLILRPRWKRAIELFGIDTLHERGILPWHIIKTQYQLTEAFKKRQFSRILKLSADLGHYIGDSNVPLHTTRNYNGQLTNQHGIHGFWESRLPELFHHNYSFWVGKATYIEDPNQAAWQAIEQAHLALDSVLTFERNLNSRFPPDKKYSFENRGNQLIKVYSREYSLKFQKLLDGQIERQLKASIKMTADFWYTAWVDAGQPTLMEWRKDKSTIHQDSLLKQESINWKTRIAPSRKHE